MTFIKLDSEHQKIADSLYESERDIIMLINLIESQGMNRWLSIGRTDIEKGFMALRKGVTERFKKLNAPE